MSFVYTPFKNEILKGTFNLREAGDDIRIRLMMTNTTADSEQDAASMAFATPDVYNGANYADIALANQACNEDDTNNRGEFDADDITWTALGAGTRPAKGMVVYKRVDGTNANDKPIAWIDSGGFPFSGNGGNVTVTWNAEGIIQAT